eukprot:5638102-Lingulodinium_polyedra.AAC.1
MWVRGGRRGRYPAPRKTPGCLATAPRVLLPVCFQGCGGLAAFWQFVVVAPVCSLRGVLLHV